MKMEIMVNCMFPISREDASDINDIDHVHHELANDMAEALARFLNNSKFDWDNDNFHMSIESKEDDGMCPHCRGVAGNEYSVRLLCKTEHRPELNQDDALPQQGPMPSDGMTNPVPPPQPQPRGPDGQEYPLGTLLDRDGNPIEPDETQARVQNADRLVYSRGRAESRSGTEVRRPPRFG